MRLLHTADWHLGKKLYGRSLLEDQACAIDDVLAIAERESVDAILLAGDIFDRAVPPTAALALFDSFRARATAAGRRLIVIAGNHDNATRLGFGAELLRGSGASMRVRAEDRAEPIRLTKGDVALDVYALPYLDPLKSRDVLEDKSLRDHQDTIERAVLAIHEAAAERDATHTVLMAHLFAAGGLTAPDSERPLAYGRGETVSIEAMHGFDYVALGHLHRPQSMGRADIAYSGSLFKYSAAEVQDEKGVAIIELGDETIITHVPLPKRRDLVLLEADMAALAEDAELSKHEDDYVIARYTDSTYVLNAAARLRERFPKLLKATPARLSDVDLAPSAPAGGDLGRPLLERFWEFAAVEVELEPGHVALFEQAMAIARQDE